MPDKQQEHGALRVYRRLLTYILPHWKMFGVTALAMVVVAATETGFAALMKPLLDGSFVNKDPFIIKLMPPLLVGIFLVRGIGEFMSTYGMKWVGRQVVVKLRTDMFRHLLMMPIAYYDHETTGRLISKLTYNVEQVIASVTNAVNVMIKDNLTVVGLLAWMFYLSGWLALTFLIVGPVIAVIMRYVGRRFRSISRRLQQSMGEVTQAVEQTIEGQRVIKAFGGQDHESAIFERINRRNAALQLKYLVTNASSVPLVQLIAACVLAGIIYIATSEPMHDKVSVGTFMSFMAAMLLLMPPLKRLTNVNAITQKAIAAGESIFALLDTETEVDSGTHEVQRARGAIRYEHVSFSYSEDRPSVLDDISFEVESGLTVAIVGRSGSGKSTLVSLLPRFYDATGGQILIDDVPLRDYRLRNLRDQIALVSQQVTLFNDTVGRNIAYGRLENCSPEEIERAAEAAHAMEFIHDLPQGMNTLVGENGVLLSGGQRQRIAIARALLKDAPILILDEATSSLDTESERVIQSALETLMKNRTTLVIAHRLSTVENADRILVMQAGRIIESGRHAELLEAGGHYAALYRMQFREAPQPVEA